MLSALKSVTMWTHGAWTCTFNYGGYGQPILRLVDGAMLVREATITPGEALSLSDRWEAEGRVGQRG